MKKDTSPDRREFLKTAGAAGVGAAAAVSTTELFAASDGQEVAKFSQHLNSEFAFSTSSGVSFKAKLSEATASSGESAPGHRQPFSLVFSAPSRRQMSQETFTVTHPQLGTLQLFAVPVDGLADETRLEAVFG